MKYRSFPAAVLWDFDGVLADTTELHFLTWKQALSEFDISLSREKFLTFFGCAPKLTMQGLLGPQFESLNHSEIRKRKDDLYNELAPTMVKLIPGTLNWLKYFSNRYPQAVASSAPKPILEKLLGILEIRSYFQVIVSGAEINSKPAPDVFLIAAKNLDVFPENCLVIEDSAVGIQAAKSANMRVIAICTSNPPTALHQADLILPNLEKLSKARFFLFCLPRLSIFHGTNAPFSTE
jgi:HAD superfamily hydrolase (TIGR01509 family)